MKILTKEWMQQYKQVQLCELCRSHVQMRNPDEGTYNFFYEKARKKFFTEEKNSPLYFDARATLRKIDYAIGKKTTPPAEKERLKHYRVQFIYTHKEALENGIVNGFDENHVQKLFEVELEENEKAFRALPEAFLARRSDPKYLALGFCSNKDKTAFKKFSRITREVLDEEARKANRNTDQVQQRMLEGASVNDYMGVAVASVIQVGKDLIIDFYGAKLAIHNINFIENEMPGQTTSFLSENLSTTLEGVELYETERRNFELHLMFQSADEMRRNSLWYVTVTCDSITEYRSPEEEEEIEKAQNFYNVIKSIDKSLTDDVKCNDVDKGFTPSEIRMVIGTKEWSIPLNDLSYDFLSEAFTSLLRNMRSFYEDEIDAE